MRETMCKLWKERIQKRQETAIAAHKSTHNGKISHEKLASIVQEVWAELLAELTTEERHFLEKEHAKRLEARQIAKEAEGSSQVSDTGDDGVLLSVLSILK